MTRFDKLLKTIKKNNPNSDLDMVRLAYDFAKKAHQGQKRMSGEPYIYHSLATAQTLAEIKTDIATIIAGILHDVPEDTDVKLEEIKKNFGGEIEKLVEGITKLGKVKYRGIDRYVENLKKMFIAAAQDPRVMVIKFADRLHNLKTLNYLPEHKQKRIVEETLKIYAPIAGLLGVWRLRWQLEDLCFKYLDNKNYKKLKEKYEIKQQKERTRLINKVKKIISKETKKDNIEYEINGRFKHLYSIWQKMQNKQKKFNEIYDVFAMRILVNSISDCYKMLGVIHTLWKPKKGRFKDFISTPKPNGYRALHTTVFGPEKKLIEFQIRTKQMHEEAIFGIASHWRYKNPTQPYSKWMDDVLRIQRNAKNSKDYMKKLKFDIFNDRIFVFTPKGDVVDLPIGATPVDFAYQVHTEIGNKCVNAIVNEKIERLDTKLKNGDLVEIITEKNRKGPNIDWLKFVKTSIAKNNIKKYAKNQGIFSTLISKIKH
ncbi:MAG: RelA/SpoT family protein [Xanthomonadaceae bacterium]|nr:RelA/SpoT family protein [Rhodospirillaceae bacterium]NIA17638.1 RelA/SpoT family protein [Xanthomonadaceae bacterium]